MIFELKMFIAGFKRSPSFLCPGIMKRTPDTAHYTNLFCSYSTNTFNCKGLFLKSFKIFFILFFPGIFFLKLFILFLFSHFIAQVLSNMPCSIVYQIQCIMDTHQASVSSTMIWTSTCCIYFIDTGGWDENFIKVSFHFYDFKIERVTFSLVVSLILDNSFEQI